MEILTSKFLELWQDFVSSFKGNLLTESRTQNVSFPFAKMALSEAVSTWTSEYTINGRWLYKLIQDEPAKGELVKEIITKDIALKEVTYDTNKGQSLKYLVPLGVGAIGYGISHLTHLGMIGTACSTLIPMAVSYPVTNKCLSDQKEKEQEKIISEYVNQLNKYKESIVSALLAQ